MRNKILSVIIIGVMMLLSMNIAAAQDGDDLLFPIGEGDFTWSDLEAFEGYDMGGEEVVIFGPWQTADEESMQNVVAYLNSVIVNGSVTYVGSDSFEQEIVRDAQRDEADRFANIAAFPQPGLAANLAAEGALAPLGDDIRTFVEENYAAASSWIDLATYADPEGNDDFYGLFYNVNLKSLVWYVPEVFEENGYEIPETWDELIELSDLMVEDGFTPWCIGIGSEAATGWPATDWVEDIMLRTQSLDVYNGWVTNEISFTDERVQAAIELFGSVARNEDYVLGGPTGVQTTDFRDAPAGLFTIPPECLMHRQASFIAAFFPDEVEVGVDADFFYFPPIDEEYGRPVLGGGTLLSITKDSEATRKVMEFFTTPLAHELWMAQSGFLTPHTGANLDTYANDALRGQGEILLNADSFGFDASDLMPGAIGAGAFWTAMVDYVGGASVEEITSFVQEQWDAIK